MQITKRMFLDFLDQHQITLRQAGVIMGMEEMDVRNMVRRDILDRYQQELGYLFKAFNYKHRDE